MVNRAASQPGVLPLRPLTVGELLDSAVALLRTRGVLLVSLGASLAAAEQALLFPLRRLADVDAAYWPADDRWPAWTVLVAAGFAAEAFIIATLGAPAAAAAPRALLGEAAGRSSLAPRRVVASLAVATAVASVCGLAALTMSGWPRTFFLIAPATVGLWILGYGLLGLAVPAAVVERLGPLRSVGRSIRLSARDVARTLRVRVLAYLSWFSIRLAWGVAVLWLFGLVYTSPDTTVDNLLMVAAFLPVNLLAYPMLACLDVVLAVEARMRTEGLDIALRQALHSGADPAPALARAG